MVFSDKYNKIYNYKMFFCLSPSDMIPYTRIYTLNFQCSPILYLHYYVHESRCTKKTWQLLQVV